MDMWMNVLLLALACMSLQALPALFDFYCNGRRSDMYVLQDVNAEMVEKHDKIAAEMSDKIIQLESEMINSFMDLQTVTETIKSEVRMEAQKTTEQINQFQVAATAALTALGIKVEQSTEQMNNTNDADLHLQSSCAAIHTRLPAATSGVYIIYPGGRHPGRSVWCDLETDRGGWTQFQRRQDGTVAFNRTWDVYRQGFGSPRGEFWLGNEALHRLTAAQPSELRVDIWDFAGEHRYAKYSTFSVGDLSTTYRLSLSGYSGDAGDSMYCNDMRPFYTYSSAQGVNSAWWVTNDCVFANLNSWYSSGDVSAKSWDAMFWYSWRGHYSLKTTSMMTRPLQ